MILLIAESGYDDEQKTYDQTRIRSLIGSKMSRKCFVIMPFASEFDAIWESVIRHTVSDFGDTCERADDVFRPGTVMDDVFRATEEADYLIADLTGRNANVFYELGYAHKCGKPVIMITQEPDDVPFDLRHHRYIAYDDSVAGARDLRDALLRFLANIP